MEYSNSAFYLLVDCQFLAYLQFSSNCPFPLRKKPTNQTNQNIPEIFFSHVFRAEQMYKTSGGLHSSSVNFFHSICGFEMCQNQTVLVLTGADVIFFMVGGTQHCVFCIQGENDVVNTLMIWLLLHSPHPKSRTFQCLIQCQ